jgi:hypothetical protein
MKLALEALDGGHVDRAYGYIQEALVKVEEHMTDTRRGGFVLRAEIKERLVGLAEQAGFDTDADDGYQFATFSLDRFAELVLEEFRPEWQNLSNAEFYKLYNMSTCIPSAMNLVDGYLKEKNVCEQL